MNDLPLLTPPADLNVLKHENSRIGRFFMYDYQLKHASPPQLWFMSRMLVLGAHHQVDIMATEYFARSPLFASVEPGSSAPWYTLTYETGLFGNRRVDEVVVKQVESREEALKHAAEPPAVLPNSQLQALDPWKNTPGDNRKSWGGGWGSGWNDQLIKKKLGLPPSHTHQPSWQAPTTTDNNTLSVVDPYVITCGATPTAKT